MRKILYVLLVVCATFSSFAQKELWGVNTGDEYNPDTESYYGNITKYDINGENPMIIHEFNAINGKIPKGKLFLASNGKLYGTCLRGGVAGPSGSFPSGVLFEYDLILDQYRVLHNFQFDNIFNATTPAIGVIEPTPGQLYGASNNRIYKYDIATETVTFYNSLPYNNHIGFELMKASDGNLYGTSYYSLCPNQFSTTFDNGCVIKFNIATNTLSIVHPLNCDIYSEGASPWSQLVETSPGKLLGSTLTGGATPTGIGGILFEYNFYTNTYTRKIDFNNATGGRPNTLINGGDGKIYGLLEEGGAPQTCNPTYNFGALYEYAPATNTLEVKQYFHLCGNSVLYPTTLMKTSNGYYMGTNPTAGLFKYDAVTNEITMPNYTSSNPNLYNAANLIEICRKPSYQEIVVDTFDACVGSTFAYDIQNTNATTYQWLKDGDIVAGQTTGILNLTNLTATDAGNYTCLMTNECGTTTTMPLHLSVNCLGINTVANLNNAVKLYPNPASEWLNIELPQNIDVTVATCTLTNLLGQTVSQTVTNNKINVSFLQQGVYIVSLETNFGKWNGKFVKK